MAEVGRKGQNGWPWRAAETPSAPGESDQSGQAPQTFDFLDLARETAARATAEAGDCGSLFDQSRGGFALRSLEGLVDGQVHLVWRYPAWGNPIAGEGQVVHLLSALGGDARAGNQAVVSLAWSNPNVVPMLHFELRDVDQAIAELQQLVATLPPNRPFGVGEIEWARPYADVASYRRFFGVIAAEAAGRPVVIDLHTGLIDPSALDEIREDYVDWLGSFASVRERRDEVPADAAGGAPWARAADSGIAHDPRPLWPLLEELAHPHPNLRFVLSHPLNPVGHPGDPRSENCSVEMAMALPNVLLGTAARREEQLRLVALANEDRARRRGGGSSEPGLWERIVFQSDGGGANAALDWVELVMGATGDQELVQKVLFRTLAAAVGVLPR